MDLFLPLQVILASGYYAAFRVTLVANALEGTYDGAIHITTDYEVHGFKAAISKEIMTLVTSNDALTWFSALRY